MVYNVSNECVSAVRNSITHNPNQSMREIAKETFYGVTVVRNALIMLKAFGYIDYKEQPKNRINGWQRGSRTIKVIVPFVILPSSLVRIDKGVIVKS